MKLKMPPFVNHCLDWHEYASRPWSPFKDRFLAGLCTLAAIPLAPFLIVGCLLYGAIGSIALTGIHFTKKSDASSKLDAGIWQVAVYSVLVIAAIIVSQYLPIR